MFTRSMRKILIALGSLILLAVIAYFTRAHHSTIQTQAGSRNRLNRVSPNGSGQKTSLIAKVGGPQESESSGTTIVDQPDPSTEATAQQFEKEMRALDFNLLMDIVRRGKVAHASLEIGVPPGQVGVMHAVRWIVWQAMDAPEKALQILMAAKAEQDSNVLQQWLWALGLIQYHNKSQEIRAYLGGIGADAGQPVPVRAAALNAMVANDNAAMRWTSYYPGPSGMPDAAVKTLALPWLLAEECELRITAIRVLSRITEDPEVLEAVLTVLKRRAMDEEILELSGALFKQWEIFGPKLQSIARESESPVIRYNMTLAIGSYVGQHPTRDPQKRVAYLKTAFENEPDNAVKAQLLEDIVRSAGEGSAYWGTYRFATNALFSHPCEEVRYTAACQVVDVAVRYAKESDQAKQARADLKTALDSMGGSPQLKERIEKYLRDCRVSLHE